MPANGRQKKIISPNRRIQALKANQSLDSLTARGQYLSRKLSDKVSDPFVLKSIAVKCFLDVITHPPLLTLCPENGFEACVPDWE